jgi:hypothetical protein
VQPVRDDAEADRQQPDDDAQRESRGPGDIALGQRPADATATMTTTPSADVSGPEKARSSRWAVTSARPASSSGRSARARRSRQRRRRVGVVGEVGVGGASAR